MNSVCTIRRCIWCTPKITSSRWDSAGHVWFTDHLEHHTVLTAISVSRGSITIVHGWGYALAKRITGRDYCEHRYFFTFVSFLSLMIALIFGNSIAVIVRHHDNGGMIAFGALYIVLSLAGGSFVWLLLGVHIYLSSTNTTTNEYCKKSWQGISGNPFSKTTCFKNIAKILFGRTTKNTADPNKIIEERMSRQRRSISQVKPTRATSSNENSSVGSKEEASVTHVAI